MDPFVRFMDFWVPTLGRGEAFASWLAKEEERAASYVLPDIEPFRDTTGAYISGRVAWREHLKRTGGVEFGHSDLKAATEAHMKRAQARKERLGAMRPQVVTDTQAQPVEPSRTTRRVLERLHGRPAPDRRTLIQMAIEERKR